MACVLRGDSIILMCKDCTEKNTIKIQKMLAKAVLLRYTTNCCDMIAMKREVAAYESRFSAERMSS